MTEGVRPVALLSDVHANVVALEAVLRAAPRHADVWVMGDVVGYGPDPSDVVRLLRERGARVVAGNHDLAVAGRMGVHEFNTDAGEAALMQRDWLSPEEKDFLGGLPLRLEAGDFTLVHGSLREPVWEYVLDGRAARACITLSGTAHCCNGHTHLPAVFSFVDGSLSLVQPQDGKVVSIRAGRVLLNPGSVGQPRDGDPRASWAIYEPESGTVTFRRTSYDIGETQRRMLRRRLPPFLAERLAYGY